MHENYPKSLDILDWALILGTIAALTVFIMWILPAIIIALVPNGA